MQGCKARWIPSGELKQLITPGCYCCFHVFIEAGTVTFVPSLPRVNEKRFLGIEQSSVEVQHTVTAMLRLHMEACWHSSIFSGSNRSVKHSKSPPRSLCLVCRAGLRTCTDFRGLQWLQGTRVGTVSVSVTTLSARARLIWPWRGSCQPSCNPESGHARAWANDVK